MREEGAERSREVFETIGAAATEATSAMQNFCSTSLKGMQNFNSKVVEFSQDNTKSCVEFVQKLAGVKSPSEFIQVSSDYTEHQLKTLAEQTKQLTALAQQVTLATAEPLKTGFAKDHAA
jgi:phasin